MSPKFKALMKTLQNLGSVMLPKHWPTVKDNWHFGKYNKHICFIS